MSKAYIPLLFCVLSSCAISEENTNTFVFGGGVFITLNEVSYSDAVISECKKDKIVCRTNGDIVFGSDNQNPKSYLKAMVVSVDNNTYSLNTRNMYNAWMGKPKEAEGVIQYLHASCFDKNNCIVRGIFSDAAGSYIAEWQVIDAHPYRTVLTSSGDLVKTFIKNINPPVYE